MARHFRSSTTPDSDSVFYLLPFCYQKTPCTIPHSPVVAVAQFHSVFLQLSPLHVQSSPIQLTRNAQFTPQVHVHTRSVHVRSVQLARSNLHLHSVSSSRVAQFRFPLPSVPTVPRICSVHISEDRWDTRTALRTTHTPRILQSILRPSGLSKTSLCSESNSSVSIYSFGYGPSYAG